MAAPPDRSKSPAGSPAAIRDANYLSEDSGRTGSKAPTDLGRLRCSFSAAGQWGERQPCLRYRAANSSAGTSSDNQPNVASARRHNPLLQWFSGAQDTSQESVQPKDPEPDRTRDNPWLH